MFYEVNILRHNGVQLRQKLCPKMYRNVEIKKEFSKIHISTPKTQIIINFSLSQGIEKENQESR